MAFQQVFFFTVVGIVDLEMAFSREPYPGETETVKCPVEGWTYNYYGNHCYYLNQNGTTKRTFEDAQNYCTELYKDQWGKTGLLSIVNKQTRDLLLAMNQTQNLYWIGLNDIHKEGELRWASTNRLANTSELQFKRGQPDDADSGHHCFIWEEYLGGVECGQKYLHMCEIEDIDLCRTNNGGCPQLCFKNGFRKRMCLCRPGYTKLGVNGCKEIDVCKNNGGCEHFCHPFTRFRKCSCRIGYQLVNDSKCQERDECKVNNGGCEHKCTNTNGSWECYCHANHIKQGLFCEIKRHRSYENTIAATQSPVGIFLASGVVTIVVWSVGCLFVLQQVEKLNDLKRCQERTDMGALIKEQEEQEKLEEEQKKKEQEQGTSEKGQNIDKKEEAKDEKKP